MLDGPARWNDKFGDFTEVGWLEWLVGLEKEVQVLLCQLSQH